MAAESFPAGRRSQAERGAKPQVNAALPLLAGKAHPNDEEGREMVQAWSQYLRRPEVQGRVVFIEDYDMSVVREMVQGVDLWVNAPRRPWEASGTSGKKVLVNGGLNLSELDGWWAEAWQPEP
jgi:starch phosphorylase